MANVKVFNMARQEVGTMELSDVIFGADINGAVLHAAVRAYLLNQRQGTQSTLTRTEVSGGGRKPWRQKGTGRRPSGFHPFSPVDTRRYRAGSQAPQLPHRV